MGRTAYIEPQCLYKGALYLTLPMKKLDLKILTLNDLLESSGINGQPIGKRKTRFKE